MGICSCYTDRPIRLIAHCWYLTMVSPFTRTVWGGLYVPVKAQRLAVPLLRPSSDFVVVVARPAHGCKPSRSLDAVCRNVVWLVPCTRFVFFYPTSEKTSLRCVPESALVSPRERGGDSRSSLHSSFSSVPRVAGPCDERVGLIEPAHVPSTAPAKERRARGPSLP